MVTYAFVVIDVDVDAGLVKLQLSLVCHVVVGNFCRNPFPHLINHDLGKTFCGGWHSQNCGVLGIKRAPIHILPPALDDNAYLIIVLTMFL